MTSRVLVVSKWVPTPTDSGGKQRQLANLEFLTKHHDVTLASFRDEVGDEDAARALGCDVICEPWPTSGLDKARGLWASRSLTSARFYSKKLADRIAEVIDDFDVVVLEYVQLRHLLPRRCPPIVWATHNIESSLIESYAKSNRSLRGLVAGIEAKSLSWLERRMLEECASMTVVSTEDLDRVDASSVQVSVSPNGWQTKPELPWPDQPGVAYVGTMGWPPNSEAAIWLVEKVWPHVRKQGSHHLYLVGREPTKAVKELAASDVTVTGTVDDVDEWLAKAGVAVAPLRAGGGTRLKILEALMAGRPVVATTVGAEGLGDLIGSGVVIADDPREFADAVVSLLEGSDRARSIAAEGRALVIERYGWDRTLTPLREQIASAVSEDRGR